MVGDTRPDMCPGSDSSVVGLSCFAAYRWSSDGISRRTFHPACGKYQPKLSVLFEQLVVILNT